MENHSKNTIPSRIRQAREQAQVDPAELRAKLKARGIELSKTNLHRLENSESRNPNLRLIEAIADITHVSPGWILFGKGPTLLADAVGDAIRGRVLDTIALMVGALDLTAAQEKTIRNWLASVRASKPKSPASP